MFKRLSIKDLYIQIIVLNLVIFLLANIARSLGSPFFVNWFAMPLQQTFMKFWTLVTANFLHEGFRHLFGNMIILLLFGWLAQHFFKRQSVLSIYVVGGIAGVALILLAGRLVDFGNGYALGASCSVFAVMIATAIYNPDFRVNMFLIGPIKLKWIALVFVAFGIVIDFSGNLVGTIGHLGGALFGAWYGYSYRRKGKNILGRMDRWFEKLGIGVNSSCAAERKTRSSRPKQKVGVHSNSSMNIDRILDKISKSGINSLTKEEKEYLNNS